MRIRLLTLLFLLAPSVSIAQITTVSGTVTDPNGIPYAGGTIKAQLALARARKGPVSDEARRNISDLRRREWQDPVMRAKRLNSRK